MKKITGILGATIIIVLLVTINLTGCSSTKTITATNQQNQKVVLQQSGVQLWSNNCVRCHNSPPPNAYSDNEWDAIVNHMQKVGGLTVTDADKIAEFLKASN
jgi:nitrate/TMAO reductase-like tetraheme cytochrome c subunit